MTKKVIKKDTKDIILDAAEKLFALEGYHGTSVRAITGEAKVNLASVNYHFGSKEALLKAIFSRRLEPINKARLEGLAKATAKSKPDLREVLRAFISPVFIALGESKEMENFVTIMESSFSGPDSAVRDMFMIHMAPVLKVFFKAIKKTLPKMPTEKLKWNMAFVIGSFGHAIHAFKAPKSMVQAVKMHGIDFLPGHAKPQEVIDYLVNFLASAMESK
jgi:AcrR family transcriptional regulator